MSLVIAAEVVPLKLDQDGVARVGGTRVTLESLLAAYCQGATAEEIAQRYPAVALSDVYAVIAYFLRFRYGLQTALNEAGGAGKGIVKLVSSAGHQLSDSGKTFRLDQLLLRFFFFFQGLAKRSRPLRHL